MLTPDPFAVSGIILAACPDKLKPEQLEDYFADLVVSHSWSTVK